MERVELKVFEYERVFMGNYGNGIQRGRIGGDLNSVGVCFFFEIREMKLKVQMQVIFFYLVSDQLIIDQLNDLEMR